MNKGQTGNAELRGPSGIEGGPGPIGLPMSDWMSAENYAVFLAFSRGDIDLEELRSHARKVLGIAPVRVPWKTLIGRWVRSATR